VAYCCYIKEICLKRVMYADDHNTAINLCNSNVAHDQQILCNNRLLLNEFDLQVNIGKFRLLRFEHRHNICDTKLMNYMIDSVEI